MKVRTHRKLPFKATQFRNDRRTFLAFLLFLSIHSLLGRGPSSASAQWIFSDQTGPAGFTLPHGYQNLPERVAGERQIIAGGVAAGDYDRDGWVDLYLVRGDIGANLLYRNKGDGTFEEVGTTAGVALSGARGSGPLFADFSGDGWLDLFIGGVNGTGPTLFRNRGDGTFENITATSGLAALSNTFGAAFGDIDLDGDLDLYVSHWLPDQGGGYLFRNNGNGTFSDISFAAGVLTPGINDFTPNFADINNDGWPDLLVAADFGTSQVFMNNRDGTFTNVTDRNVITDENGMGAAIGDYDHDGDLDWFVSSIKDPNGNPDSGNPEGNWGVTGNRLYRNRGDGTFEDATDAAGVRDGFWGWGSCFGDFNNDGRLDLYHVNGFKLPDPGDPRATEFHNDPARFFVSNQNGTFTDQAAPLGVADTGQGRGLVCFDYDRDGDLDLFIANNQDLPRLYRNDGGNALHYLNFKLKGHAPNTEAIGARIYVTTGATTQMQELRAGSNFVSQDPVEPHFGLGNAQVVDTLRVVWPDGTTVVSQNLAADRMISLQNPAPALTWATGETKGVDPDIAPSGEIFTFKVIYADFDNNPPSTAELWVDRNDDGAFAEGVLAAKILNPPSSRPPATLGSLVALTATLILGGLLLRLQRSTRWKLGGIGLFLGFVFLIAVMKGCSSGGGGTPPSTPTPTLATSERFAMKAVDAADEDYTDGKAYSVSVALAKAGDGIIKYRFVFSDGVWPAAGAPTRDHLITIQ